MQLDKVVGGAHQEHAGSEDRFSVSQSAGAAGEGSQAGAEGGIQALGGGSVDLMLAPTGHGQHLGHRLQTP